MSINLTYFKELLLSWREKLLKGANDVANNSELGRGSIADPTDRAQLEENRITVLRIMDRERKLIKKIDEALERIENGTFGICISCGEEISKERLKVRPVADLCIECKSEEEKKGKIG